MLLQPLAYFDLLDDVFIPIATDGASSFAVSVRLQKALAALSQDADDDAATRRALDEIARRSAARTRQALSSTRTRPPLTGSWRRCAR